MATTNSLDPLSNRQFLLVEDFEAMRGVLKRLLLRCGAPRVDAAASGNEAAGLLRKTAYDVVLCDYNLGPGKNGQQLLEEARHQGWIGPAAVWVMITAEKTNDMVSVAAEDAPDDYLLKPITEGMLQTRLQRLVERKDALAGIAAAMKAREWRRALQLCGEQLAAGTKNAGEVLRLQGELHQRLKEWPQAQALYESVLQRAAVPWAKLGLAQVLLQLKDVDAARQRLQDTVREHPQFLQAYDSLAQLLGAQGEHEEAVAVLERALRVSPNSAGRQAKLGNAALEHGQAELAATAFKRSMKLAEHSAIEHLDPFLGMARLHSEGGAPDEAHKVLAELRKRYDSPGARALALSEEVRALKAAGDDDGAQRKAAELGALVREPGTPLSPESALRMADTLMAAGQRGDATELLQFVTRNNHDDELTVRRAQQVFDRAGLGDTGSELLAEARRDATEAMSEGVRLMAQGELHAALDSLRAARAAMPQNARVLLNFAAVALTTIEREGANADLAAEARAAIDQALRQRPDDARGMELKERLAKLG